MYKMHEIRELIRLIDETSLSEFKLEGEEMKLTIKKEGVVFNQALTGPSQVAVSSPDTAMHTGASQSVGALLPATTENPHSATPVSAAASDLHQITAPMVGTFYRAPSPDAPPYVNAGSQVTEQTVVCIIEAMKLLNELEAEVSGEIVEVLAQNGQLVEFGQPLFTVRKSARG